MLKEVGGCFATRILNGDYECNDCDLENIESNNMIILGKCVQ
jgi:hypothetical protein